MNQQIEEILDNTNVNIEKIIENLINIFEILEKPGQIIENEMTDLLIAKVKMIRTVDSVLLIFKDLVKLKYIEFKKGECEDKNFDFEEFYKKTFASIVKK